MQNCVQIVMMVAEMVNKHTEIHHVQRKGKSKLGAYGMAAFYFGAHLCILSSWGCGWLSIYCSRTQGQYNIIQVIPE